MNANKKNKMNSGWILCPSKTFAGKFYYFNVLNGETAWSLDDAEKKIIKRDGGITKVIGSHHHPEPTSPPTGDLISTLDTTQPSFGLMKHPTPVFGQSVFPRPLPSKQEEPNVIWTPIQIQVPIVLGQERVQANQTSQVCKESQSQSKSGKEVDFAKDLFVHSCNKPLSHRFVNYEKPVIKFDKNNKIKDKKQFEKFYTSTPTKKSMNIPVPTFKASNTDLFQSKSNLSFSDLKPKTIQQKNLVKESVFSIELPSKTPEKVFGTVENQLKQIESKDDGEKAGIATASSGNFCDDLRMFILAKKRKFLDSGVPTSTGESKSKKIKTVRHEPAPHAKKRVTFNLEEDISRIEHEDEYVDFKEKYSATVQTLKDLAGPGMRSDQWCIVVDAEVLLEEYNFLDNFVQIDPDCKLVIPPSVHAAVCAVSRGDCRGRARVNVARHLVRKLPNAYTIVQAADGEGNNSPPNDAILKSCVEAMDQNIHVILITDDQELLTTAKCYPIHCYSTNNIKNGLAPKLKTGYKQLKITIRNTDAKFTQNGPAIKTNFEDDDEDLNENEKEILRQFKQVANSNGNHNPAISNDRSMIVENSVISKENSVISNKNSVISNVNSWSPIQNPKFLVTLNNSSKVSNDCSRISKQKSNTNSIVNTHPNYKMDSNENSKISNTNSMISLDHSTIAHSSTKIPLVSILNSTITNKNSRISNENSTIYKSDVQALKALTTEWRYATSDITETTTIDVDMKNLNLKEKTFYQQKTPLNNSTTLQIDQNSNETVSFYFQKPSPKFDFRKFKTTPKPVCYFQNGGEKTFIFDGKQKPLQKDASAFEMEKRGPVFETNKTFGNENVNPVFETNKTKEPRILETGKEKTNRSIFEIDVFKKPQNVVTRNTNIDLSRFYVKNKIMENRLQERMDEWVCTFKQIMEESLAGVLEKLSPAVLKSMAPPWSMYEALQCSKTVYKDHNVLTNIVDELCAFLYESDYRTDKLKKIITPNEFIKAFGCGIELIKYLKNILQHSNELLEAEECLMDLLKQIENPMSDINEPLVKTPVVSKTDDKEVRQNFVKTRSEIINYLKKHYTVWQAYNDTDNFKTKIVRTFGRDLNLLKLDKKFSKKDVARDENATKNVVVTKNVDVATKNVEVATKSDCKYAATDVGILERAKVKVDFDIATKNDNVATRNVASCTELVKTKSNKMHDLNNAKKLEKDMPKVTKNIDNNFDSKEIAKPKQKSIFDFMVPKNPKIYNLEDQEDINDKYIQKEKFQIDRNMLDVQITVPNDYTKVHSQKIGDICNEDKNVRKKTDSMTNINENHSEYTKEIDKNVEESVKPPKDRKNQGSDQSPKVIEGNENGPKIVRNVHLIVEFENRLKTRQCLDLDELDYSPDSPIDSIYDDDDDDVTHYTNTNDCISHQNYDENDVNDHSRNANKDKNDITEYTAKENDVNDISENTANKNDLNDHSVITAHENRNDHSKNYITIDSENNDNDSNDQINHKKDDKVIKNDQNQSKIIDLKTDVTYYRKFDKDDMTNDSGFGNESPHIYSVVKSFSRELGGSLDLIRTLIDDSLQEFREGKLREKTKKKFRLKAFEANFLITKIIIRLNIWILRENGQSEDSNEKIVSKNTEAVTKCLEQAQILQKALNAILSMTNEEGSLADLNSSMSLNLSS